MWIKISLVLALFALLAWSALKLYHLNRREKNLRRHFREPVLNSKNSNVPDKPEELRSENKQESVEDDNDFVLGLKSTLSAETITPEVAEPIVATKGPSVVIIYLMAPTGRPYMGYELLQALLASGLRFGAQNIFHRHETKNGTGPILFHLASANAPGTFELSKMGAFTCPGLSFFMPMNDKIDNVMAFEAMLDTANELQTELGGELLDQNRKNLSLDKITEHRLTVRAYQQSEANRLPDFFEQVS